MRDRRTFLKLGIGITMGALAGPRATLGAAAGATAVTPDPRERHLTNIKQLTNEGENAEAYFSPDGNKLIFQRAAKATGEAGEPLLVACTQERRLFAELNEHTEGAAPLDVRPIHFVNIRETGGWSRDAKSATPKIAALLAAAPEREAGR